MGDNLQEFKYTEPILKDTLNKAFYIWHESFLRTNDNSTSISPQPIAFSCNINIISLISSKRFGGFLTYDGYAFYWVWSSFNKDFFNSKINLAINPAPVEVIEEPIKKITCGVNHIACLGDSDTVYFWDFDKLFRKEEQFRNISDFLIRKPLMFSYWKFSVVKITSGSSHLLILLENGSVYGIGDNSKGALGHSEVEDCSELQIIRLIEGKVIDIVAGNDLSACITDKKNVYYWGYISYLPKDKIQWTPKIIDTGNLLNNHLECCRSQKCDLQICLLALFNTIAIGICFMCEVISGNSPNYATHIYVYSDKEESLKLLKAIDNKDEAFVSLHWLNNHLCGNRLDNTVWFHYIDYKDLLSSCNLKNEITIRPKGSTSLSLMYGNGDCLVSLVDMDIALSENNYNNTMGIPFTEESFDVDSEKKSVHVELEQNQKEIFIESIDHFNNIRIPSLTTLQESDNEETICKINQEIGMMDLSGNKYEGDCIKISTMESVINEKKNFNLQTPSDNIDDHSKEEIIRDSLEKFIDITNEEKNRNISNKQETDYKSTSYQSTTQNSENSLQSFSSSSICQPIELPSYLKPTKAFTISTFASNLPIFSKHSYLKKGEGKVNKTIKNKKTNIMDMKNNISTSDIYINNRLDHFDPYQRKKLEEYYNKISNLEMENKKLQKILNNTNEQYLKDMKMMYNKLKEKDEEKFPLKNVVTTLQRELFIEREEKEKFKEELNKYKIQLQGEIENKNIKKELLNGRLLAERNRLAKDKDELKLENNKMETKLAQIELILNEVTGRYSKLEEEYKELNIKYESLDHNHTECINSLSKSELEIYELKKELEHLNQMNKQQKSVDYLYNYIEELETMISQIKSESSEQRVSNNNEFEKITECIIMKTKELEISFNESNCLLSINDCNSILIKGINDLISLIITNIKKDQDLNIELLESRISVLEENLMNKEKEITTLIDKELCCDE
ncbi:uncharacterized protein CMU_014130 [Cryptosporidium muris RN66]|uniref:Regulator of chromosome condensation family protein n=1 Tax=Cryptosporidium muris (strain RN66) TaxID=441375 RepID=B6AEX1_CRYMR|nr:uncharacterized protein CMU_014130 [Cryptosporidium muris RN66]EEA06738.1 hypothetical protein, conserved [Cryptosporidium muris RN66]|eukprot:XP_002141087.1 hypothetical protein [Cryptosporidium muris RN66]